MSRSAEGRSEPADRSPIGKAPWSSSRGHGEEFRGGADSAPRKGVLSKDSWSCGQDPQPKSECHRRRIRATRREARARGFDCRARWGPCGSNPTSPLVFSPPDDARGFSPSFFRAAPIEGWEGRNVIMPTERNLARRRGGEEDRERRSRRVSQAVDAQRRLNIRRADDTWTTAPPVGPRAPRYAYLTDSHD